MSFTLNRLILKFKPKLSLTHSIVILGLLLLYIPIYYRLVTDIWQQPDFYHGPIVLVVVLYLFWDKYSENQNLFLIKNCSSTSNNKFHQAAAWVFFILGLIFFTIGKSQDILILSVGSQILIFPSLVLMFFGFKAFKVLLFPVVFIIFMVPLPSFMVDFITIPMKIAVSEVAEQVLYYFGYPIARDGVILHMGQYQLLVADACAGMHTLISLEALGLLYLSLVKHDSLIRNGVLATLIIPISFTANVIRVIVLVLITFYFGDEVGQGFIHGFAGMLLFVIALTFIMTVDSFLQKFVSVNRR